MSERLDSLEVETANGTLRYVPSGRGSKWYNLDTHRFVKFPFVWRYTYGVNFVFHSNYYGGTIQAWSGDYDTLHNAQGFLYETLLDYLSDFVHTNPAEFWFDVNNVGDGYQKIPLTTDIIDSLETYTVEITDERGSVILEDESNL